MGTELGIADLEQLRLERDLSRRLLELGAQTEPMPSGPFSPGRHWT